MLQKEEVSYTDLMKSFNGWNAYSKWSNSYNIRKEILKKICKIKNEIIANKSLDTRKII